MNLREMDIRREERQAALAEGMQIDLNKGLKQGLNQGTLRPNKNLKSNLSLRREELRIKIEMNAAPGDGTARNIRNSLNFPYSCNAM